MDADFTFSQSSVQDYLECPRRFELRYWLEQRWPAPEVDDLLRHEALMQKGARFHHRVQQHHAGVPEAVFRQHLTDPDLRAWFERYLASGLAEAGEGYAEVTLTVPLGDHLVSAKYDRVLLREGRALIIDWKTTLRPPARDRLAQQAQTIIYPYVLARGGAALNDGQPIAPDEIGMVYWFAVDGQQKEFRYSAQAYYDDEARLLALLDEIAARQHFPMTDDVRRCRYCVYRSLCNRGVEAGALEEYEGEAAAPLDDFTPDLDQIAEVEF